MDLFAAVFNKKTEYFSPILKVKNIETNTSLESFQSIKSILEITQKSIKNRTLIHHKLNLYCMDQFMESYKKEISQWFYKR